ncbi:DinB family protein [Paenibacillus hamazuiensis]|uniref:DinB family protein n=1 Tax=Paenibacillus hamazuiensis TaxID=2936508 RepID=UPI00200F6D47|nr:DinB family protein [Paenibacillus hamazuiensis]
MNISETLQQFEKTTNHYIQELDRFSLEQLRRKPGEDEWSLGQMYMHLIGSALKMQLANVEKCLAQGVDATASEGEMTDAGRAVFGAGSFPPVRIQAPQPAPPQPESKEQIVQGLHQVASRMNSIGELLEGDPPSGTAAHPRFGALNAREWFGIVEMHYRHHLHQKERLEQFFKR